jgi:hypothetical protein
MCVWCASATFRMEADHGRSRAWAQWLNTEDELQQVGGPGGRGGQGAAAQ